MKIREILLYSHAGELRRLSFKVDGLNIITGSSSTGKSALSEIIEYCMGRSSFNIPEGTIRDKVAWYGVIYKFSQEEVLIAKPAPSGTATSCSTAMMRRGVNLEPPAFTELAVNSDDDTVVSILSGLLGIPSNQTVVDLDHSRDSFSTNIKHTYFYLFQKQALIANKDQLFYRQNEQFMPQAIRDTLPILLGVVPEDRIQIEAKLRTARRELKLTQKQLADSEQFSAELNTRALGLLSEAKQIGIVSRDAIAATNEEILKILADASNWKPVPIPDEDTRRITEFEDAIDNIRKERKSLSEMLRATRIFAEKEDGFTSEADEQKSRLESIHALPINQITNEWQWPFAQPNLGLDTSIGQAIFRELQSLDRELQAVIGERPRLDEYTRKLEADIENLNSQQRSKEEELASVIASNAAIAEMGNRNNAAARTVGRISLFLETYRSDDDLNLLRNRVNDLKLEVSRLEEQSGADDSKERFDSIINIISRRIGKYTAELGAEFSEYPSRIDLSHMTVVIDRPDRPVPLNRTGGGENHLAYHLAALLSLHHFAFTTGKPIPSFLMLDQPTQVYFPSEEIYKSVSGDVDQTERNSDMERVRKLFNMLHNYTSNEAPGFQIIVTEHANLRDRWFQESLIEIPWAKPPALVPEEWGSI